MNQLARDDFPAWAKSYIGIEFRDRGRDRRGVDCWGLVYLVLNEQFGLSVPAYLDSYADVKDKAEIDALIRGEMRTRWHEIENEGKHAGNVALFRIGGWLLHVGIVLNDRWMLHCLAGANSSLASFDSAAWRLRLEGFFEYA